MKKDLAVNLGKVGDMGLRAEEGCGVAFLGLTGFPGCKRFLILKGSACPGRPGAAAAAASPVHRSLLGKKGQDQEELFSVTFQCHQHISLWFECPKSCIHPRVSRTPGLGESRWEVQLVQASLGHKEWSVSS